MRLNIIDRWKGEVLLIVLLQAERSHFDTGAYS
jgi:hypothetical protein